VVREEEDDDDEQSAMQGITMTGSSLPGQTLDGSDQKAGQILPLALLTGTKI